LRRYCITDNLAIVRHAFELGAETIQIRAKELPARDLAALVRDAVAIAGRKVLVNTRADVALALGAGGVHLTGDSIAPSLIRRIAPGPFVIGVSCHNVADLRRAEAEGADFAVYGPVFATGEKRPIGLAAFAEGAAAVGLPVYALGGVTKQNAEECLHAGAAGIAGISLFLP
jgi:thiamine-phosphate pyrophosphorylase